MISTVFLTILPCYNKKNEIHKIPHCQNSAKIKIVERGKIDSPTTQIHDLSRSLLGTDSSMKNSGDK